MKLKTLFSIYAVVAALFCVGLLLMPAFWITLYGAHADSQATVLLRLVGALMGGLAIMSCVGRNAEPSRLRDAIVLGFIVSNGLAAIVAVSGALTGAYNQFAWGPVATFALFAIGFQWVARAGMSADAPN